jgi:D-alanyl-D-alanine carboxypeptidase
MYKIYTIIFTIIFSNFLSAQTLIEEAKKIIEQDSIPEMAFAIITKDSVIVKKVIGHHKISEISNYPTSNIDDYFHLGSNTKAITGFIAAKLVEKKKLNGIQNFLIYFPN